MFRLWAFDTLYSIRPAVDRFIIRLAVWTAVVFWLMRDSRLMLFQWVFKKRALRRNVRKEIVNNVIF
jgi:hypothetical protein